MPYAVEEMRPADWPQVAEIYLAGIANSLKEGFEKAEQALEEGKGLEALERLREASHSARADS